jgi:hypothetical protein
MDTMTRDPTARPDVQLPRIVASECKWKKPLTPIQWTKFKKAKLFLLLTKLHAFTY